MMPNYTPTQGGNSVNDNGVSELTNNGNVPLREDEATASVRRVSNEEADRIADILVAAFDAPVSRAFYCKVAYMIPEAEIDELVKYCQDNGDAPERLFGYLVKRQMSLSSAQEHSERVKRGMRA
jgi:hypothetical protein